MTDQILVHHGVKGQKWGVRRYQNEDGTLTEAGKKRYSTGEVGQYESRKTKKLKRAIESETKDIESLSPYKDSGIYTKSGKQVLTSNNVKQQISGIESVRYKNQSKLEKQQKRDSYKAKSIETKQNMSVGKKATAYVLGGPFGPTNYSNYKAAGYSDKAAIGRTWFDGMMTGGLSTARSTRVRNKAADKS